MWWPLSRLLVVFDSFLFVSVLLPAAEQRKQLQQRRRVRQQRKAKMVAIRFVRGVYDCPSAVTHTNPRNR